MKRYRQVAGFILAGGASSRMGRNKGLLDFGGIPLMLHTVRLLQPLVAEVTIVGSPSLYARSDCAQSRTRTARKLSMGRIDLGLALWQLAEHFRIEQRSRLGTAQPSTPKLCNGSFPAHAAGRTCGKSSGRAICRRVHAAIQRYAHKISRRGCVAWHPQGNPVLLSGDDALGK